MTNPNRLPALIATCGGIGHAPMAPGTWASVAAIPLGWALHAAGGFGLYAAATLGLMLAGVWATRAYLGGAQADPPEVVIDEVVGMLIAMAPLSLGLSHAGAAWHVWPWPGWGLGFLLFRFFDILKPPPVSWAERVPGAWGVMLDDVVAGLIVAVISTLAAGVAHGWF